jgi:hypothetical protein
VASRAASTPASRTPPELDELEELEPAPELDEELAVPASSRPDPDDELEPEEDELEPDDELDVAPLPDEDPELDPALELDPVLASLPPELVVGDPDELEFEPLELELLVLFPPAASGTSDVSDPQAMAHDATIARKTNQSVARMGKVLWTGVAVRSSALERAGKSTLASLRGGEGSRTVIIDRDREVRPNLLSSARRDRPTARRWDSNSTPSAPPTRHGVYGHHLLRRS